MDKQNYINGSFRRCSNKLQIVENMRQLYDRETIAGKYIASQNDPLKTSKEGTSRETEQQLNRWAEHFEQRLNRPATLNHPDIQPATVNLPIKCDKYTKEEISGAIKHLK